MNVAHFRNLTYRCLCTKLQGRFGVDLAVDKRRLLNRRKSKDESWQHMAEDMYRLAKSVYNGSAELAEREAKFLFIKALPDNLRIHIAAANPPTLTDAVANVTQLCAIEDITDRKLQSIRFAQPDNSNNSNSSYSNNSNSSYSNNYNSNKDGDGNDRPYQRKFRKYDASRVRCFRCRKLGHYARNCQTPEEDLPQQSENSQESQL